MDLVTAREQLIEIGRRIWVRGFAAANDGNLSVRLDDDRLLVTSSGSVKGFLTAGDFVVIDRNARVLEGAGRPSSEIRMHLAIYEERPDVRAVVHAHPPTATGFATAGVPLDACVLPEIVTTLGSIATVPYATPSTDELASAVRLHVKAGHACVLANHGAVSFDAEPMAAYYHLERVEHFAKILLTARLLGGVQVLSRAQVDRLGRASGLVEGDIGCRVFEEVRDPDVRPAAEPGAGADGDRWARIANTPSGRLEPVSEVDDTLIELIASEVRRVLR
jgi:L-fuculose-phosphate aldolase